MLVTAAPESRFDLIKFSSLFFGFSSPLLLDTGRAHAHGDPLMFAVFLALWIGMLVYQRWVLPWAPPPAPLDPRGPRDPRELRAWRRRATSNRAKVAKFCRPFPWGRPPRDPDHRRKWVHRTRRRRSKEATHFRQLLAWCLALWSVGALLGVGLMVYRNTH